MDKKQAAAFATISLAGGSLWIVRQMVAGLADQLWTAALADLLSALALGVIALLLRIPKPERKAILSNMVLGATFIACPYLLTLWAAPTLSPGLAVVVPAATPLVVGFFCDAPWSARNASIAGLAGVILLVADSISLFLLQWPGAAALLVALVATAGSLVFAKRTLQHSHPVCSAAIQLATAAAVLGGSGLFLRGQAGLPGISLWIPALCLGAGACIIYPIYFWLLQRSRPDQLASVVWAQLVVSVAEGIFFLHPPIKFRMVFGVVVIGAGLAALARSESENKLLTDGVTTASKLR